MSQSLPLSQGSLEERFAHILQPIRDLTKNWDIDIANYLEEYLGDLGKVEITFDDGMTTMNFSEAALLIQGTAGVYAKKVEYLYSLVFQVLDLVTQNKKSKTRSKGEERGEDGEDQRPGDDDEFLVLDDDVDIVEKSYRKEQDQSIQGQNKSVLLIPDTPRRFTSLQEVEKEDTALYNKKGDVCGNMGDFNIDLGYMTSNGSLLMETGDRNLLTMHSRQALILGTLAEEERSGFRGDVIPDGDEEDDFVFPGGDVVDECDVGDQFVEPQEPEESEKQPLRRSARKKTVKFANTKPAKKVWDQQALLDPYESSKAKEKPLVKKKPYRIPGTLTEGTAKKRKRKTVKKELRPMHEIVETLFSHKPKFPKNTLKVPEFPELEDAFWKEYKIRDEENKLLLKKLKQQGDLEATADTADGGEENDPEGLDDLGNENDDPDDLDDRPALCLGDDLFEENRLAGDVRALPSDTGFISLSQDDVTLTYEDMVKMHVEKYLTSAAQYAQITELSRRVSEWEEKISPKLEEEQTHPTFDIHKYGTDMIEQMVRGERFAFRDLVKGMNQYQICRYTLAILQLANVYNVELSIVPSESGSVMDSLYVTLLSTKRHFESLEEYKAPSLNDTET